MGSAHELVEEAVAAHGGWERWRGASELTARVRSGGFLLATRCRRGALRDYVVRVSTTEPRATFEPYPTAGRPGRGTFETDRVRIERPDGSVAERRDPRAAFRRSLRRNLRWDDLDLLYFAGYAMWNYLTTPYLLARPGVELAELEPWHEGGETWRRLTVRFPADVPTHSTEQVFHFDVDGRLRRLDYTAEVVGGWAKAAHYCEDHRSFDGLVVPTRRRVYPRRANGRPAPAPTLVALDVGHVALG